MTKTEISSQIKRNYFKKRTDINIYICQSFFINNKKLEKSISSLNLNKLVTRMGFGPMYVALRGLCVKPLHQRAINNNALTTLLFYHLYIIFTIFIF